MYKFNSPNMNNIDKLIENLNKEQKEAVLNTEGPNLIVAGAGSGKTRVLTTRLIHIINPLIFDVDHQELL